MARQIDLATSGVYLLIPDQGTKVGANMRGGGHGGLVSWSTPIFSALFMIPKTVDRGHFQIVQVNTWELLYVIRRQQRGEHMFLVLTLDFSPGVSGSFDLIVVCGRCAGACWCTRMLVAMGIKTWCAVLLPNSHGGRHSSEEHGASDCGNDGTRPHRTPRGTSDRVEAQHDVWNDAAFVHLTCASVLCTFHTMFVVWLRVHV